jgi:uncharacterized repeat protein (TIGR03803 family)
MGLTGACHLAAIGESGNYSESVMPVNKSIGVRLSVICGFLAASSLVWAANQENVLFTFSGADGSYPVASLTFDAGNLYGITSAGGRSCYASKIGCGTVFQLSPGPKGKWTHKVLHKFGRNDGAIPTATLIVDAAGNLYGSTYYGGDLSCLKVRGGCGIIFELSPGASGKWTYTILHTFHGKDGAYPGFSLVMDAAGNLYGATGSGGDLNCGTGFGCGVVFELTPGANGKWTESILHAFSSNSDGNRPNGLIFDAAGNLYSATAIGGSNNYGIVFELTPHNGKWTKKVLYNFDGTNGAYPQTDLVFDTAGNLYGTAYGSVDFGTVFELKKRTKGDWTHEVLLTFHNTYSASGYDPGQLIFDASGNLYSLALGGSFNSNCLPEGCGLVFELSPGVKGQWTENVAYDFCSVSGCRDGDFPSGVILDSKGNLYGSAYVGGNLSCDSPLRLRYDL